AGSLDEHIAQLTSSRGAGRPLGVAVGLAWLAVAGLAARRSRQSGNPVLTWPALTALGLSLAALVPVAARWVSGDPARASLLVEAGGGAWARPGMQGAPGRPGGGGA